MNELENQRIDEVDTHYQTAVKFDTFSRWASWVIAALSLLILFPGTLGQSMPIVKVLFIVLSVGLFIVSLTLRLHLIPNAERKRRKQLLSDAFGAPISSEKTERYYNNGCDSSLQRLAANIFENTLHGKENSKQILQWVRIKTFGYFLVWLGFVAFRHSSMDLVLWITQLLFSADILSSWWRLEVLQAQHERTYQDLHSHFLHKHGQTTPKGIASILDSFANYESTKATAGILLSQKVFHNNNEALSKKWADICTDLGIPKAS